MPWIHCNVQVLDDRPCPKCGVGKPAWTLRYNNTRVFQIKRPKTLEIVLLDEEGQPLPRVAYSVVLEEGDPLTGRLDADGFASAQEVPSLECQVVFEGLFGWQLDEEAEELWVPRKRKPVGCRLTFRKRSLVLDLEHVQPGLVSELVLEPPPQATFELVSTPAPSAGIELTRDDPPAPAFALAFHEPPTSASEVLVS